MMGTASFPKSKVGRKDATNSRDARKRGKSDDGISASRVTEALTCDYADSFGGYPAYWPAGSVSV